jgi:hypothetical protein
VATTAGQNLAAPGHARAIRNENNSRAELSCAYLHALVARAGFTCSCDENPDPDRACTTARLDIREQLDPQSSLREFSLELHLWAVIGQPAAVRSKVSCALEVDLYDRLRSTATELPRFMALLCLPEDPDGGLTLSAEHLIGRPCARWLCLQGAPETSNTVETTVRVPVWNVLTPEALREIARRVSLGGRFFHEQ